MTYRKPTIHALDPQTLSASCCDPCRQPGSGGGSSGGGGGGPAAPAPCYILIGATCFL